MLANSPLPEDWVMLACDRKVAYQIVRIWGAQPIFQVHINELATDDRGNFE
jgi:hypothetical protein